MEKKNKFPGTFIGPSYTGRVSKSTNWRTINMYLETAPSGAKDDEPGVLIGMPGLKLIKTIGTGPIRSVYTDSLQQALYVVSGYEVWRLKTDNLDTVVPFKVGTIGTGNGYVSIADNGIQVVFVDGINGAGWYCNIVDASPVLTQIVDPQYSAADTVTSQDGYFIFNKAGTAYYFISDLYDVTFPALNEANKSGASDLLTAVISNNRMLHLLGTSTIEIWTNTGASGVTPFARADGNYAQIGCLSPGSITKVFQTFMFLGSSNEGGACVYTMEGGAPVRVSNHAVETTIQNLPPANLALSTAYSWQIEGHYFYVLNIPGYENTWVYDLSTQNWTEQQSSFDGFITRHRAQDHAMYNGKHVVGDYKTGDLYYYDFETYTENGQPIRRVRQAPHLSYNLNRIFYKMLEIDFEPGTGNNSAPNPRVTLEISDDGGKTWKNPIFASIGRIGDYLCRARWQRLGTGRDRVFRVSCSDPVKFNLVSCFLDMEVGNS